MYYSFRQFYQELMSSEAAKERVTPVPSKSKLLTYFRFGSVQCVSCGLRGIRCLQRTAFLVSFKTTTFVMMVRLNEELFICCIRTRLGDTCCNWSLHFKKEGVSKWWGVPGSSNLPHFCGKSLSLSPVRLAISLWLGQRRSAEWVSNFSHCYHRTRGFLCRHYDAQLKNRFPYLEVR